jgi:hypothetical protein
MKTNATASVGADERRSLDNYNQCQPGAAIYHKIHPFYYLFHESHPQLEGTNTLFTA